MWDIDWTIKFKTRKAFWVFFKLKQRKFENDEISSEQINEIVKKELTPLRPLFISSKNIKERVFSSLR